MTTLPTIEVVAALIIEDGAVLATQRGYGDMAGGWEFPGGKVEPDETPEAALVREIAEELATTIALDRFVVTVEHDYPTFHLVMHCYQAHLVTKTLLLKEHADARWLDAATLDSVAWLPADVAVVAAIRKEGLL